ncbi:hypothetical protein DENSPDRAFT_925989 [Dentipellis sp. KUC8613]|nr:hypothetical protein DENSPDRAFT_925989 [Dentipellis sp. KUC8613]
MGITTSSTQRPPAALTLESFEAKALNEHPADAGERERGKDTTKADGQVRSILVLLTVYVLRVLFEQIAKGGRWEPPGGKNGTCVTVAFDETDMITAGSGRPWACPLLKADLQRTILFPKKVRLGKRERQQRRVVGAAVRGVIPELRARLGCESDEANILPSKVKAEARKEIAEGTVVVRGRADKENAATGDAVPGRKKTRRGGRSSSRAKKALAEGKLEAADGARSRAALRDTQLEACLPEEDDSSLAACTAVKTEKVKVHSSSADSAEQDAVKMDPSPRLAAENATLDGKAVIHSTQATNAAGLPTPTIPPHDSIVSTPLSTRAFGFTPRTEGSKPFSFNAAAEPFTPTATSSPLFAQVARLTGSAPAVLPSVAALKGGSCSPVESPTPAPKPRMQSQFSAPPPARVLPLVNAPQTPRTPNGFGMMPPGLGVTFTPPPPPQVMPLPAVNFACNMNNGSCSPALSPRAPPSPANPLFVPRGRDAQEIAREFVRAQLQARALAELDMQMQQAAVMHAKHPLGPGPAAHAQHHSVVYATPPLGAPVQRPPLGVITPPTLAAGPVAPPLPLAPVNRPLPMPPQAHVPARFAGMHSVRSTPVGTPGSGQRVVPQHAPSSASQMAQHMQMKMARPPMGCMGAGNGNGVDRWGAPGPLGMGTGPVGIGIGVGGRMGEVGWAWGGKVGLGVSATKM